MHSTDTVTTLQRGAIGGMIGGAVMAMFAMTAAVTYQHNGFFTPLFHISALTGSPDSMMTSVMSAAAGDRFWFTPGAAVVGLIIHMLTGAVYGMGVGLLLRAVPRAMLVPAGVLSGVAVFAMSTYVGLPIAASLTGSGSTISDMAEMVGYGTFVVEHMMFGLTLGVLAYLTTSDGARDVLRRPALSRT